MRIHERKRSGFARRVATVMFLAAATITGCKGILDVSHPGSVPADILDDPTLANTILLSAIGDFECAYAGYTFATALWSNEVDDAQASSFWQNYSERIIPADDPSLIGDCATWRTSTFRVLQTARIESEDAVKRFLKWNLVNKDSLSGQAYAYAGYSTLLLTEGFCEVTFDGGPIQTKTAALQRAEGLFTSAITSATAANDQVTLNMARIGRARTRLNLADKTGAVADASLVPQGYIKYADRGAETASRFNKTWTTINFDAVSTVNAAYRNVTYQGVPDPRVQSVDAKKNGFSGTASIPIWYQLKYPNRDSKIPLAKWEEAQLIIAEVQGGQTAVNIINALHTAAGLPSFSSTDPVAIQAQVVEERRRALWLEGQRMNDMLRLNIPFASGTAPNGHKYGTQTCLPLPLAERIGNPNIGK